MTQKNRIEHGVEIIRYNKIDENIWIGTNQCCQMHFEKKLLEKGITADISLEEKRVDAPFGVKSYLWLPTKDHTPPTQDQLQMGAEHIGHLVDTGKKLYVHCKNGHGRAPTLVAGFYIFRGLSVEKAIKKIKSKRSEIHIEPNQRRALERFQKRHAKS